MPDRPLVRRRTTVTGALAAALGVGLAAGCDTDDLRPPQDTPAPAPTPSATTAADEPTPDQALVDQTLTALDAAVGLVVAARRFAPLRAPLASLLEAHRVHVEVLGGSVEAGRPATATTSADAALRAVTRSERALQQALATGSAQAESGALARLLASASASVTQHLAVLPAASGGDR